jgi:uncharacterized membrane protein
MNISNIILVITSTLSALVAGLFFGWSVSITLGLARVSDTEYISVFQATNRAIINPVFLTAFLGTQILLPVCLFLFYQQTNRFWLIVAATIVYTAGVTGVTFLGNIPFNDKLDRFNLSSATPQEITQQRKEFETPWNRLNTVRTVSSTLTIMLLILACLDRREG